jgi:hypothetical protein
MPGEAGRGRHLNCDEVVAIQLKEAIEWHAVPASRLHILLGPEHKKKIERRGMKWFASVDQQSCRPAPTSQWITL